MVIVLGIDFGNESSRIASLTKVNRPGQQTVGNTLTVIVNESSERSNPCLITFKGKQRFIGDAAVNVRVSNAQNTISEFKMLIGKQLSDPDVVEFLKYSSSKLVENSEGELCSQVDYNNETTLVPVKTAVAYFFTKLKEVATFALEGKKAPLTSMDAVISVPAFFDQQQRIAVIESAQIAGIQAYTVVSDIAAICMEYGFPKTDLPVDTPVYVVFVLMGNAYTTVSVCEFKKDNFSVVSHASTTDVSGRVIDRRIADHFAKVIEEKNHLTNVMSSAKNKVRLLQAAISVKKVLTGGQIARFSVENISDIDFSQEYRRPDFEELIKDLVAPLNRVCEEAVKSAVEILKLANPKSANPLELLTLHAVEILGGTSRIPLLKQAVEKFFNRPLSTTLNSEDCVAKGCMLIAVQLSPYHRGRSIQVCDALAQTTGIKWCKEGDEAKPEKQKFLTVFKQFTRYPITQRDNEHSLNVTFKRTKPFTFYLQYENQALNHHYKDTPLSIISVADVPQPAKDVWPLLDPAVVANLEKGVKIERQVRVRTTVKITGCTVFDGAFIEEDYEHEEKEKVYDKVVKEEVVADGKEKEKAPETAKAPAGEGSGSETGGKAPAAGEPLTAKTGDAPANESSSSSTSPSPTASTSPSPSSTPTPTLSSTPTPAPAASAPNTSVPPTAPSEAASASASAAATGGEEVKKEGDGAATAAAAAGTTPAAGGEEQKKNGDAAAAPTTAAAPVPAPAPPKPKYHYVTKKTKKQRRITLNSDRRSPIVTPEAVINKLIQVNVDAVDRDRVLRETTDAKNQLEQYIYSAREKIDGGGEMEPFIAPKEKEDLLKRLDEVEEWMNEESVEDMQKSAIVEKYNSLHAIGSVVEIRFQESKLRPEKLPLIFTNADLIIKEANKPEKAHIPEADRNKVIAEVEGFVNLLKEKTAEQEKKNRYDDPVFRCDDVVKEYQKKWKEWNKVLSQKPPPPPAPAAPAPAAAADTPSEAGSAGAAAPAAADGSPAPTAAGETGAAGEKAAGEVKDGAANAEEGKAKVEEVKGSETPIPSPGLGSSDESTANPSDANTKAAVPENKVASGEQASALLDDLSIDSPTPK